MKEFLMYWGRGYQPILRSSVSTLKDMQGMYDKDVLEWAKKAEFHESTWEFSGPCDEFFIMRVL